MVDDKRIVYEGRTEFGQYQIIDTMYDGRPARVLYSGDRQAAQSGVAKDDDPDLLFDYNQRFFELAANLVPGRVLIIGGGVYTLASALLAALPTVQIDVVEPDRALTSLALRFFGLVDSPRLRHFHVDGRTFLAGSTEWYDLIVIDAFIHTSIPRSLMTLEAARAYKRHLAPEGVVAMNVISGYHGGGSYILRELYAAFCHEFRTVDIFYASRGYTLWLPQNFVLTGQVGTPLPLKDYVRHAAVQPPEVDPSEALSD